VIDPLRFHFADHAGNARLAGWRRVMNRRVPHANRFHALLVQRIGKAPVLFQAPTLNGDGVATAAEGQAGMRDLPYRHARIRHAPDLKLANCTPDGINEMDPPLCGLALISHHEVSDTDLHTTTSRGEKVIAIIDHNGYVLSPVPVVPVNRADTVLLPEGLKALKRVAKLTGLSLHRSYLNLGGGFDSKSNRQVIFNAGLIPNIKENPRHRKTTKRGRKRLFDAAMHTLRDRVERTFAWEDKCKRLLLRFEHIQQRHYGMKLMAYTLINVRHFCGT
jgi:hypothetical protein